MGEPYSIQPQATTPISTRWRSIQSPIPHPDSVALLEQLRAGEPVCMEGQPPVVWDRAAGASVWDAWGNRWIDLTSGVLIANAGHGRPEIAAAITEAAARPLLTTYCFPHHYRA
jgi:4-aminobutyrate aminotransferase-like enzyme